MDARNIEFAAHHSVFESQHFREQFLVRTASRFGDRLFRVFSHLIKRKYSRKTMERLKAAFQLALEIKILIMMSKDVYEVIWPTTGNDFDDYLMKEEPLETFVASHTHSGSNERKVLIPLVPGLRIYSFERKAVDYFGLKTGREEGLGEPEVLAKSIVATQ
jgi:hypothetical protein